MWPLIVHPNCYKKFLFFLFVQYKNEWKKRKFRRKKNQKSDFYKNKKIIKIDDIDDAKMLVSKEESHGTKNSFNTLLDTMIMMLLDHYAWSFYKWLAMLENLKVIQQCLLRLVTANC